MSRTAVLDYIRSHWSRSIYRDADGSGFGGIDLPHSYTSPCMKGAGHFCFFFYWDTYFTNLGLLRHGHVAVARDNCRNMFWLIDRQGYMPNHVGIDNRSQPPWLAPMVADYVAATGDTAFLAEAAPRLRQEYHFWTTARHTPLGLQRHGHHETAAGCREFYDGALVHRLGLGRDVSESDKILRGGHGLAEAETGWDFNPRFDGRCLDHAAVDLNGLLHFYETFLGTHAATLGWDDAALWSQRAERRRERVQRWLWNESRGCFLDYDYVHQGHSPVPSLAGFLPLYTGLATPEQAARMAGQLTRFERDHGVAVTADVPGCRRYQWAFPNVWPPLVYVVVTALRRYGHEADARRIAGKFLATTERLFARTGQLWEKTDAETGEVAGGEYAAAPMLGWTAGTYVALAEYLDGTVA
jgi:alpha,alpha-trehalase